MKCRQLIPKQGLRFLCIIDRVVQLVCLELIILEQRVIRAIWEQQRREHQCVDRLNAIRTFKIFQVMPEDVVPAEKSAVCDKRIEFLRRMRMQCLAVFCHGTEIRDGVMFRVDFQINKNEWAVGHVLSSF